MQDLTGKVAFVTGGANGIGFGMVRAFLAEGMKVVVADVSDDHIAKAKNALKGNNAAHFVKANVADRGNLRDAVNEALDAFGHNEHAGVPGDRRSEFGQDLLWPAPHLPRKTWGSTRSAGHRPCTVANRNFRRSPPSIKMIEPHSFGLERSFDRTTIGSCKRRRLRSLQSTRIPPNPENMGFDRPRARPVTRAPGIGAYCCPTAARLQDGCCAAFCWRAARWIIWVSAKTTNIPTVKRNTWRSLFSILESGGCMWTRLHMLNFFRYS